MQMMQEEITTEGFGNENVGFENGNAGMAAFAGGYGDEQQAAGVLVDAVDDAGSRQLLEFRCVTQQPVHQRACRIAGTGMHDESRGLVDDEQMLVLVDDVQ